MASQSLVNPGYCIVQQPGTLDFQARLLFNNPNSDAARYFMQVNSDAQWSKPGQMLILDVPGSNNSVQLKQLQLAKKKSMVLWPILTLEKRISLTNILVL